PPKSRATNEKGTLPDSARGAARAFRCSRSSKFCMDVIAQNADRVYFRSSWLSLFRGFILALRLISRVPARTQPVAFRNGEIVVGRKRNRGLKCCQRLLWLAHRVQHLAARDESSRVSRSTLDEGVEVAQGGVITP